MTYALLTALLTLWTIGWVYLLRITWDRKTTLECMGGYWAIAMIMWFLWPWGLADYVKHLKIDLNYFKDCNAVEVAMRLDAEKRIEALESVEEAYLEVTKPKLALVPKEDY